MFVRPIVTAAATSLSMLGLARGAAAQDLAAQYLAAAAAFQPTGSVFDPDLSRQAIARLMDDIVGRWVPMTPLLAGNADFDAGPEAAALVSETSDSACARENIAQALSVTSPYRFELLRRYTRDGQDNGLATVYTHMRYNLFFRETDEAAYLEYLGVRDPETGEDRIATGAMLDSSAPTRIGPVAIYHPSEDVLVVQPDYGPAEIYLRCPGP